jgi:signal peptidase I
MFIEINVVFLLKKREIDIGKQQRQFVILTDSMEPTINVGDLVIINTNCDLDELEVRNIIAFFVYFIFCLSFYDSLLTIINRTGINIGDFNYSSDEEYEADVIIDDIFQNIYVYIWKKMKMALGTLMTTETKKILQK